MVQAKFRRKESDIIFMLFHREVKMNNLYQLDEMFIKIRTYLEEYPCTSICEMSAIFEIDEDIIFNYCNDNRINILFG